MPKPAYMIDLDYVECCQYCKQPLLIGELARDIGQPFKAVSILFELAKKARINGILIFYDESLILGKVKEITGYDDLVTIPTFNRDSLELVWSGFKDMQRPILRMKQVYPRINKPEIRYTAKQYFDFLQVIHEKHELTCEKYKLRYPLISNIMPPVKIQSQQMTNVTYKNIHHKSHMTDSKT
jgi:uncharacterized protein YbaR (Trm112 family)